jgi:ribosomal protein L7/L12
MYLPMPVLAVLGVAALLLLLLAFRRRPGERDLIAPPRTGSFAPPPPAQPWAGGPAVGGAIGAGAPGPELAAQVRALCLAGDKLEAIKLLRAATHSSLTDAKETVERLSAGEAPAWPAAAAPTAGVPPELEGELRGLLAAGNKIEAIRLLREATGSSLADAKAMVERL